MKIVWFCSFDPVILDDSLFIFNKKTKIVSPWITYHIDLFKNKPEVELHIVSFYPHLKKSIEIKHEGIYFHFISQKLPFFNRGTPHIFRYYSCYFLEKFKAKRIINKINPDIIDCHGTDQDFSAIALSIKKPTIITLSTFVQDLILYLNNSQNKRRLNIEKKVIRKFNHFGIRAEFMKEKILSYHKGNYLKFYWYNYPIKKPSVDRTEFLNSDKKYDLVFAARIEKNKGPEDFIKIVHELSVNYNNSVRAVVIGPSSPTYKKYLLNLITKLGVEKNIDFIGFLEEHDEVFEYYKKSKVYVIPTYFDMIPGSLIEAMHMGIPSATYEAGGIPELNKNRNSIIIEKVGDYKSLTSSIIKLLGNSSFYNEVSINAVLTANEKYDNEKVYEKVMTAYQQVINEYNR